MTPKGRLEIIAELGGGPNGAAVGPDGVIFVTNNGGPEWITDAQGNTLALSPATGGGSIQVVEPRTGKWWTLYDRCNGRPIGCPTLVTGAISDIWLDSTRVDQYLLPDPVVTNVCFGGPALCTAFATLSMHGRLVAFDWPRPGLPLRWLPH